MYDSRAKGLDIYVNIYIYISKSIIYPRMPADALRAASPDFATGSKQVNAMK